MKLPLFLSLCRWHGLGTVFNLEQGKSHLHKDGFLHLILVPESEIYETSEPESHFQILPSRHPEQTSSWPSLALT